jgi:hypothetical protein
MVSMAVLTSSLEPCIDTESTSSPFPSPVKPKASRTGYPTTSTVDLTDNEKLRCIILSFDTVLLHHRAAEVKSVSQKSAKVNVLVRYILDAVMLLEEDCLDVVNIGKQQLKLLDSALEEEGGIVCIIGHFEDDERDTLNPVLS